ncbi:hypothetical protein [Hymenobacter algoricola]|uniref:Uncharacterized protein n=1 Tax=Hymenobacter algoricola TaxID=486267 RepID=A0ABP7MXS4_9BACT
MKSSFHFLILILLLGSACKKEKTELDKLPEATRTGQNTGGCLIDGQAFVATGWGGGLLSNGIPPLDGGFSLDSLYIVELNGQHKGQNATITLFFRSQQTGRYFFNQNTLYFPVGPAQSVRNHATYRVAGATSGNTYGTGMMQTGYVDFSLANVRAGIGAGTFEFTAANTLDPTKIITVTNGRFDRKQ